MPRFKFVIFFVSCVLVGCGGGAGLEPSNRPGENLPKLVPYALSSGSNFGTLTWPRGSTEAGGRGARVGNVGCLINERYHAHAHLTIIKDGTILAVPADIGMQGCAYEVHTHDSSGIIHVETEAYHRISLGDFFAVWGRSLSLINVAELSSQPLNFYITENGTVSHYAGDPAEIELVNHREITVTLGQVPTEIPTFQWPANL